MSTACLQRTPLARFAKTSVNALTSLLQMSYRMLGSATSATGEQSCLHSAAYPFKARSPQQIRTTLRAIQILVTCRQTTKVRSSTFYTAPNVLVVNLPLTDKFGHIRKEQIQVFEQLNLTRWMHPEAPEIKSDACLDYDLVAVIIHSGKTSEGGHYYTFSRRPAAGNVLLKCSHYYRSSIYMQFHPLRHPFVIHYPLFVATSTAESLQLCTPALSNKLFQ